LVHRYQSRIWFIVIRVGFGSLAIVMFFSGFVLIWFMIIGNVMTEEYENQWITFLVVMMTEVYSNEMDYSNLINPSKIKTPIKQSQQLSP